MADKTQVNGKVLVVDDDAHVRRGICLALKDSGHYVVPASDGTEAFSAIQKEEWDLVLSDLRMPGMDGMELLKKTREAGINTPFIMITAHGTVENAVEAMKAGAWDYILKPFSLDELDMKVLKALERSSLERNHMRLSSAIEAMGREAGDNQGFSGIIGSSKIMKDVFDLILRVAHSDSTVLITGESGTGKELVARALHQCSDKKGEPYISVNCAAVPETLLESELFGHVRGAFTGASENRAGRFELAQGGTLFLDEIGELPMQAQAKLLRAVQEKEIERVGSSKSVQLNVRIVTATNRILENAVEAGNFREDLLWRLKVIEIHLPPLRDRQEDILLLASHFIDREKKRLGRHGLKLHKDAQKKLISYHWPGNVRELSNLIERAALLSPDETIGPDMFRLSSEFPSPINISNPVNIPNPVKQSSNTLPDTVEVVERDMISAALKETGGNVAAAARKLGLKRTTLLYRMDKLGIKNG